MVCMALDKIRMQHKAVFFKFAVHPTQMAKLLAPLTGHMVQVMLLMPRPMLQVVAELMAQQAQLLAPVHDPHMTAHSDK